MLTRRGYSSTSTEGAQFHPGNGESGMCPAQFSYLGLWLPCEQAGLHKSPSGLYNFPFLQLRGNAVKKGKIKKSGVDKESADWTPGSGF